MTNPQFGQSDGSDSRGTSRAAAATATSRSADGDLPAHTGDRKSTTGARSCNQRGTSTTRADTVPRPADQLLA